MAKQLEEIYVTIKGTRQDNWAVAVSADLVIHYEEYPEIETRKGIAIELTPEQETQVKNFVKNVVLPQVEL